MKPYKRTERVANLLRQMFSDLLLYEVKDPRVEGVVITHVNVSSDLRNAKIYFRVMREEKNIDEVLKGLCSVSNFLKAKAGKELKIMRIPKLEFVYDKSIDEYERVMKILDEIK